MPRKPIAEAGTYILVAEEWHEPTKDGSYVIWYKGDEVELNEADATRFMYPEGPRRAFKKLEDVDKPFKTAEQADDSSSAPLTPENADGVGGGNVGPRPINPGSKGPGSPN